MEGALAALPGAVEEPPMELGRLSGVPVVTLAASKPSLTAFNFSFASAYRKPTCVNKEKLSYILQNTQYNAEFVLNPSKVACY